MEVINDQAHLDAALNIVSSVSQCHVVSLSDLICNVLFSALIVCRMLRSTLSLR